MQYSTKDCRDCGSEFQPRSGAQRYCDEHKRRSPVVVEADEAPVRFTVPDSLEAVPDRPNVEDRQRRTNVALKLGRTALRAGYRRLAWNYAVYADQVARGFTEPDPDKVRRVFGHGF